MPIRRLLVLAAALALAACGTPTPIHEVFPPKPLGTGATLAGTVSYREPVVLPDGAVLEVRLVDVSRADGASLMIGRGRTPAVGLEGNISYSLSYDPAKVDAGGRYALTGRIEVGNQVLFATADPVPVLTGDDRRDHDGRANFAVMPVRPR